MSWFGKLIPSKIRTDARHKKSIPEVYKAAGIKFDFSKAYIKELMDFVKEELNALSL